MGVILDSAGDLFGTTMYGGTNSQGTGADGIVFELHHGANSITWRGTFLGTNGSAPNGGLQLDSSGNLFGTTYALTADSSQPKPESQTAPAEARP